MAFKLSPLAIFTVAIALPLTAYAQDRVRVSDENPVATIAKATLWGALAGLALGGATALLVDDNQEDIIKWFFAGGTFFGFGYGLYHVSTRPKSVGLLDVNAEGLAFSTPTLGLSKVGTIPDGGSWRADVTLVHKMRVSVFKLAMVARPTTVFPAPQGSTMTPCPSPMAKNASTADRW